MLRSSRSQRLDKAYDSEHCCAIRQQPLSNVIGGWKNVNLDAITVKALLITGPDDQTAPPQATHGLAEALPNARLDILDECGHFTTLEWTSAVNEVVAAFI
jgi:pimeloyl-ACP methyl ester carboxylesterase